VRRKEIRGITNDAPQQTRTKMCSAKNNGSSNTHVIYLHGFASGPGSTKAVYFETQLKKMGIAVDVPDLNEPSFFNMTLTSQLEIIDRCIEKSGASDLILIGSSMGGLLATLRASCARLRALVLLAPGFGLPRRWTQMLGEDGLARWRDAGETQVFHWGMNADTRLSYDFIDDALQYVTDGLKVDVPTLVFHGKHDDTVPVQESIDFASHNQSQVVLHVLDDDHNLIDTLERTWLTTREFLESEKLI